jgi:hypothetical protein
MPASQNLAVLAALAEDTACSYLILVSDATIYVAVAKCICSSVQYTSSLLAASQLKAL